MSISEFVSKLGKLSGKQWDLPVSVECCTDRSVLEKNASGIILLDISKVQVTITKEEVKILIEGSE